MKQYRVKISFPHSYTIEANDADEAKKKATRKHDRLARMGYFAHYRPASEVEVTEATQE